MTEAQATNSSTPSAVAVPTFERNAELLITDIHGLSGIRQVSPFHAGGAIPSNPEFLISTLPGHILDPERLLVGSTSNYGLTLHDSQMLPGALLSLGLPQRPYAIPEDFAVHGNSTLEGKVMLYSAQSKNYLNNYYNDHAVTAHFPNVSNPKYISINNAFGRPWQANSPFGVSGKGHVSVSDPDGRPLANPPSIENGGVFYGELSNRIHGDYYTNTIQRALLPGNFAREKLHQYIPGDLNAASISTVFMGVSPDSSNFAVFAVVGADGRVSQIHVQDGVDGLVKEAVITPHKDDSTSAGMVFSWTPNFALFITDFYGDRIAVIDLINDENVFKVKNITHLSTSEFKNPVDIAAAIPEIANPRFSSNTTLAGNSDLYVANQNGTLLRIDQDGRVLAKVKVKTDFENNHSGEIKNICVSYDAQTIFIGMEGENNKDFIVKIPAFNADGFYSDQEQESTETVYSKKINLMEKVEVSVESGRKAFIKEFSPQDGVAHVFNASSCVSCHDTPILGGFSVNKENFTRRVSHYNKNTGQFDPVVSHNFPVAKRRDIRQFGKVPRQKAGIPAQANIVSLRMPLSLLHIGRLDEIPDYALIAHARSKGDGIQGRVNYIETKDGKKIGRYGWKANQPSLQHMVADAMSTELGLDNPFTLENEKQKSPSENSSLVQAITRFLKQIHLNSEES